jgi:hypothetical protein
MEGVWRLDSRMSPPDDWQLPLARTIDAMKVHVVSETLDRVDWNSEIVRGDLGEAVRNLKQQPGGPILTVECGCHWHWPSCVSSTSMRPWASR